MVLPHPRRLLAAFTFLLSLPLTDAASVEPPIQPITVSPNPLYGPWEGWGTSLCWWAHVYGERDDVADLLFTLEEVDIAGAKLPGLGMTIVRYNLGACADQESGGQRRVKSRTIRPYREMPGYWIDESNPDPNSAAWDWTADARQRAMLLKARDRGATHFELFSNSPMWWMCANLNPSGAKDPHHDNLDPAHERDFARYLAEVARRAQDHWGIRFTTVEPFNEPVSGWWDADCKQEGCHFSPEAQIRFLPLLREELDRCGLTSMPIAASDENQYSESLAVWERYPDSIKALVSQVNVHGYQGKEGPRAAIRDSVRRTGQRLWNSEHGDGDPSGLFMARCLLLDLQHLQPTAWCYWQPLDEGGWGMIESNLFDGTFLRVNPKYYVAAQFLRHIRPGMTLVDTGHPDAIAALDASGKKLVVIVVNDSPQDRTYELTLQSEFLRSPPTGAWLTCEAIGSLYRPCLTEVGAGATIDAKANSVLTLEFQRP